MLATILRSPITLQSGIKIVALCGFMVVLPCSADGSNQIVGEWDCTTKNNLGGNPSQSFESFGSNGSWRQEGSDSKGGKIIMSGTFTLLPSNTVDVHIKRMQNTNREMIKLGLGNMEVDKHLIYEKLAADSDSLSFEFTTNRSMGNTRKSSCQRR